MNEYEIRNLLRVAIMCQHFVRRHLGGGLPVEYVELGVEGVHETDSMDNLPPHIIEKITVLDLALPDSEANHNNKLQLLETHVPLCGYKFIRRGEAVYYLHGDNNV